MPQLDTVTYLSQFFWLCFFFLGFYFAIVQFFLPKMARILKFRQEKMEKIQEQSSSYMSDSETQLNARWANFLACLEIQRKIASAQGDKTKEIGEEAWETTVSAKSLSNLDPAFLSDYLGFQLHMTSQNATLGYFYLTKKKMKLSTKTTNRYFLDDF